MDCTSAAATTDWLIHGVIIATSVIGQLYVSRMRVAGFYFWTVSNIALIAVWWQSNDYGMVALYAYFLVMAVYSILHWRERQELDRRRQIQHAELLAIADAFVKLANVHEIAMATDGSFDPAIHLDSARKILLNEGVLKHDEVRPHRYKPAIVAATQT